MSEYYDGTKLLSMLDLNGAKPEIYICTSNRSAGKTTYYNKYAVNKFKKNNEKFMLIYRYNYELDDCADKFFKDLESLFFHGDVMTSKRKASGIFHELFLNEESCGYAISLNSADQLKKYSHLFSDVCRMIFDEFQSETNHYCSDEIRKFISIHTSVARGQGKQARYLPVYMIGNPVSIINPYYVELGISERLRDDTKFLRGDGYVLEQGFVKSASQAQRESGFNKAFARNSYVAYSSQCVYLNDNKSFIEKPDGIGKYLCTLRYNGTDYGVREFAEAGCIYVDDKSDSSFRFKITVTTNDHEINYVMLKRNDMFLSTLRIYFENKGYQRKFIK